MQKLKEIAVIPPYCTNITNLLLKINLGHFWILNCSESNDSTLKTTIKVRIACTQNWLVRRQTYSLLPFH